VGPEGNIISLFKRGNPPIGARELGGGGDFVRARSAREKKKRKKYKSPKKSPWDERN